MKFSPGLGIIETTLVDPLYSTYEYGGYEYLENGYIIGPDGTVMAPDGSTMLPDGTITGPAAEVPEVAEGFYAQMLANAPKLIELGVMFETQRKLLQVNYELAKQGKPPLRPDQFGMGVNVGATADTRQMIYILGFGALAIFALMTLTKK
jgi:hypothetical protein